MPSSVNGQNFSALDNPNSVFAGKNVLTLEVPCFKSLDPVHVVNALNCGFDGVMAVVCSAQTASFKKEEPLQSATWPRLFTVLKKNNLLDRFAIYEESPRCADEFGQKLDEFYKKISALPKCAITVEAKAKRTK